MTNESTAATVVASPLEIPLREGELDLIPVVAESMRNAGLGMQVDEVFFSAEVIELGQGKTTEAQRFYLNRFWTQQLSGLQNRTGECTVDTRFCLLDKGDPKNWLNLFKEVILPVAMKHQLPVRLN